MNKYLIKIQLILLFALLSPSFVFTQIDTIFIDGIEVVPFTGPNLVPIHENFYADETEVNNIFYKEYLHWLKTIYGVLSDEYLNALPDLSVWAYQEYFEPDGEAYFRSAEFDEYPLVGITLNQAKRYSEWRTERVAEMYLINIGYLNVSVDPTPENHFTIQRLIDGQVNIRKDTSFNFVYPVYTIPTAEEWDKMAGLDKGGIFGVQPREKHNYEIVKNGNLMFHTLEVIIESEKGSNFPTRGSRIGCKNVYGLYHTIGNVAELVDQTGVAKGGDWMHFFLDADFHYNKKQNIPNCWTGFRNVAKNKVIVISAKK